jgi:hypothetical protein
LTIIHEVKRDGLKLPGSPEQCKISVFADDNTGILITDKSIKTFLYLINLFGKASGCFDICKTLPIYHIFDDANTLTTMDFSNKDKCLDFHKFNTFSNFT